MKERKNGTPEEAATKLNNGDNHHKKHPLHPALAARIWKPGQSGNLRGRPKKKTPSEILDAYGAAEYGAVGPEGLKELQKRMPEPWRSMPIKQITTGEFIGWVQMMQAMRPAGWRDRELYYDRVEGRSVQKITVTEDPNEDRRARYDWRKLSTEDLLKLKEIQMKAVVGDE
jgi:hypothetical protein